MKRCQIFYIYRYTSQCRSYSIRNLKYIVIPIVLWYARYYTALTMSFKSSKFTWLPALRARCTGQTAEVIIADSRICFSDNVLITASCTSPFIGVIVLPKGSYIDAELNSCDVHHWCITVIDIWAFNSCCNSLKIIKNNFYHVMCTKVIAALIQ